MNATAKDLLAELNKELADAIFPVTIFVGLLILIGCIANVILFYLLARHYEKSSLRTLVMCLAFIDFLCTITTMPGDILSHRLWYTYPSRVMCKVKDFFNIFTVTSEAFCLFLVAYERYVRFVKNEDNSEMKHALLKFGIFTFLAAIIAFPVAIFWGIRSYPVEFKNTTVIATSCARDAAYEDTYWPEAYEFSVGVAIAMVVMTTACLYVKIDRQTTSSIENMADDNPSLIHRQTRIFCVITLFFFITTCLFFDMIGIHGDPHSIFQHLSTSDKVIYNFFLRLYFIQHVINPLIYGLGMPVIRGHLRTCICPSWYRHPKFGATENSALIQAD